MRLASRSLPTVVLFPLCFVEQANIMMKKEVIERIKTIKQSDPHNNVSFSDL